MKTVALEIKYTEGPTINASYFVGIEKKASGEEEKWAVRASWLLDPKLHAIANTDDSDEAPKLELQPEQIIEEIAKTATDLESFKTTTASMAVAIHGAGVGVKAAEEDTVWSVEEQEKGKVVKEPIVSMESGLSEGKIATTGGSKVAAYFGRLPKKSIGAPTIALDMQSKIVALEEQVKTLAAEKEEAEKGKEAAEKERDGAKQEVGAIKKSGEAEALLKILEKLGIVEDEKDKEEVKEELGKIDVAALKAFEKMLKKLDSGAGAGAEKPKGGNPFPPKKPDVSGPPKPPVKPGGAEGIFSSEDNVVQGSLNTELDTLATISQKWIEADNRKRGIR